MTLPVLALNIDQLSNTGGTLGFEYVLGSLKNSGAFEIKDHKEKVNVAKGSRGTVLFFNGKRIYLDFWEYTAPTNTPTVLKEPFDLIIKLQHQNMSFEHYWKWTSGKNMYVGESEETIRNFYNKIIPWTFFPSRNMMPYVGKENEIPVLPVEQFAFFCGRNWKSRHPMKAKLDAEGIKFFSNNEGQRLSDEDYMHYMLSSQYGIALPGRSTGVTDSKNRREIDYMMMRKPLMISYKPFYYDPLIPGKHYIFIDGKTDFKAIPTMYNMEEMVKNAWEWYQNNATPAGIVKSFLKIMADKGFMSQTEPSEQTAQIV